MLYDMSKDSVKWIFKLDNMRCKIKIETRCRYACVLYLLIVDRLVSVECFIFRISYGIASGNFDYPSALNNKVLHFKKHIIQVMSTLRLITPP